MQTNIILDLAQLYKRTFGSSPYHVPGLGQDEKQEGNGERYKIESTQTIDAFSSTGGVIKENLQGVEIVLPVRFYSGPTLLMHLPHVVVKINNKKIIAKTAMNERKGSVKEQYSIDDYVIGVKGFLINPNHKFPEEELETLKYLYETRQAITLDNALTNIYLTDPELSQEEQRRVVVDSLDIAEVQGGRINVRPFSMSLLSDSVFTLELED